jgi:hypothetical protein
VTVAIPPCGTFQYVAVVPESEGDRTSWNVRLCAPVELTGDDLRDDRLVGYSPTLELSDAGITPDVRISSNGRARPRVLSPRDMLFMARTGCGGLGVSIVRDGQLIAAVGAASAVPLGELLHVRIPSDTITEAEGVFRKHDPKFTFPELPVEIRSGDQTRMLHRGQTQLQSYKVFVEHGFYRGAPGTNECVAVWLTGTCPDIPAIASAQLLDFFPDPLEIVRWSA